MNPQDIPIAGPTELFFWHAIEWLNPVVQAVGLAVAIWAFRSCRKLGYLVVAFYFALALFSLLVMPTINRAIRERRGSDISEQTQQKINVAVQQTIDRVMSEEGHPVMPAKMTIRHYFPFGSIILVAGLWLIARQDFREHQSNLVERHHP